MAATESRRIKRAAGQVFFSSFPRGRESGGSGFNGLTPLDPRLRGVDSLVRALRPAAGTTWLVALGGARVHLEIEQESTGLSSSRTTPSTSANTPSPASSSQQVPIAAVHSSRERVMNTSVRGLLASLVLLAGLGITPVPASAGNGGETLARQVQQLENVALSQGVQIADIRIRQQVGGSGMGAAEASCTATATLSIPGGTGVDLSATASTCADAVEMLEDAIAQYIISNSR